MSFWHSAQTRTRRQVSTPYPFNALAAPSFPSRLGTPILTDCRSEGSLTVDDFAHRWTGKDIRSRCRRQLITFDMLPDDVLLETFDFYVGKGVDEDFGSFEESGIVGWITLTHVCRRWRSVVFRSPRRLNLRLLYTAKTRARDTLDIWPPLPLIIRAVNLHDGPSALVDNIIAALEHNDRVCRIDIDNLTISQLGHVANSAAILKPFPELTGLRLTMFVYDEPGSILPDSLLGGTAPRLQSLKLDHVPFAGLPKLLLSATHLVRLELYDIPRSGYSLL